MVEKEKDIVERLMELARSFAVIAVIDETNFTVTCSDGAILVEAAGEIERLRADVRWHEAECNRLKRVALGQERADG